jgi:hypothetical protein
VAQTEGTGARRRTQWSMASGHSGARKLVGGGTTERGEHGELVLGLIGSRAELEEGDNWWGPPISQARRGAKAAIGQSATDAWSAGPRGRARLAKRPRTSGERESVQLGKEKGSGPRLGRKSELCPIQVIKHFQILFEFWIFGKL